MDVSVFDILMFSLEISRLLQTLALLQSLMLFLGLFLELLSFVNEILEDLSVQFLDELLTRLSITSVDLFSVFFDDSSDSISDKILLSTITTIFL